MLPSLLNKEEETPTGNNAFGAPEETAPNKNQRMMAEYSFKANLDGPLGQELSVTEGEKLFFLCEKPGEKHWWLAQNDHGDTGYVPSSYMVVSGACSQHLGTYVDCTLHSVI